MDFQLSPLQNNITVCFCMIAYFKISIEVSSHSILFASPCKCISSSIHLYQFACWMRLRLKRGISRPMLHMVFSSAVIFWPYFDQSEWSWRLNALVPAVMCSRMVYKGAIVRDPADPDVQNMSLSSSPGDLLFGPCYLALIMWWLGMYQFSKNHLRIFTSEKALWRGELNLTSNEYSP
jgi:hypothetical protein